MSTEDSEFGKKSNGTAEEDGLSRARTRVSRACTRCRSRKDKCDGKRPSCSTCLGANQTCSYEPATKKRGLPEGYVRGLEKLWAILIHKIDGIEDIVAQILGEEHEILSQIWNHHHTGEELHLMWKESRVLQELETLLASLDHHPSTAKRKRDKEDDEEDGVSETAPEISSCLNLEYKIQKLSDMTMEPSRHFTQSGIHQPAYINERITLPPNSSKLLNHYFTYTHNWFPILDRPHMLKKCYEWSRKEFLAESTNTDLAILTAVLAYSSQQFSASEGGRPTSSSVMVTTMSGISRRCIPPTEGPFELGHVQALLVLVLLDIGLGKWDSVWLMIGLAVRIMLEIGESKNSHGRSALATFQACFILDTIVALRLGRKPQLNRTEMTNHPLMQEDGHEEWEPWAGPHSTSVEQREPAFSISCFNRLTELFMILNDLGNHSEDTSDPQTLFYDQKSLELDDQGLKYPFAMSDRSLRPPHQMWLQLCHLCASGYITACSKNFPAMLQALSWMNAIVESYTSMNADGTQAFPPFLIGILYPVFATLARPGNERLPFTLSQPQEAILDTLMSNITRIAKSWPETENLVKVLKHRPRGQLTRNLSQAGSDFPNKRHKLQSQDQGTIQSSHSQLNLWPSDPFAYSFPAADGSMLNLLSAQDNRSRTVEYANTFNVSEKRISAPESNTPTSASGTYGSANIGNNDPMSVDTLSVRNSIPGGIPMPSVATSPSFQGDEIDALFHEMAQLDTTEWTSGRTQGLREFGFTDDLTFEAFCNDPERLMSTNAFDLPGFDDDNPASQMYTPPNPLQPHRNATNNSFDILTSSWNG